MAEVLSFSSPDSADVVLTQPVQLGWAHDIVTDETGATVATRRLDDKGNPIPTVYLVPRTLRLRQLRDALKALGEDRVAKFGQDELEDVLDIVGAVIGTDTVKTIADDPTVSDEEMMKFITWCAEAWGLYDSVGDGLPN